MHAFLGGKYFGNVCQSFLLVWLGFRVSVALQISRWSECTFLFVRMRVVFAVIRIRATGFPDTVWNSFDRFLFFCYFHCFYTYAYRNIGDTAKMMVMAELAKSFLFNIVIVFLVFYKICI